MMAWLNAVPQPPEGSKRAAAGEKNKLSRNDKLTRDGTPPSMPPNPMPHLIARFIEIGITEATGMGPAPLSWREIKAWQWNTAVDLAPWEARLMRSLSLAYIGEAGRAESENCPPPWNAPVTEQERNQEDAMLRLVLG